MRSVVVVLPASICAQIPMLRVRSNGTRRSFDDRDASWPGCFVCSNTSCISRFYFLVTLLFVKFLRKHNRGFVPSGDFTFGATSGSVQTHDWPAPSCAYPHAFSRTRRYYSTHPKS